MQAIERLHPHEAAQLIRAQHAAKRLGARLAVLVHGRHKRLHRLIRGHGQAAVFQQTEHVRRTEGLNLQQTAAALALLLVFLLRAAGGLRQLAPLVHVRQVEERAVLEPEVLPVVAQRLQDRQNLRRGLAVFAQLQLQRALLHAQHAGEVRLARG